MAERATREFTDDHGEHIGQLMVEIIEHDGETATVKWRIVDRNGNTLNEQDAMKVPRPTRGETKADDLLAPAIAGIVQGRVAQGGSDVASKAESRAYLQEEMRRHKDDWDLILMIMKKLSHSKSDDDDGPLLGRVLSLFR